MAGGSTPLPEAARRLSSNPTTATPKPKEQQLSSNTTSPAPANGVARTRSVRTGATGSPVSARAAAAKRPTTTSGAKDAARNTEDDDSKAETAAAVEELKEQLRKAEIASEDHQKELFVVQSRLDEALAEQTKMEEASHGVNEKIEALENDKKEALRRIRDLETKYDAAQTTASNDKEEAVAREEELNQVIQRLKETMLQKEERRALEHRSLSRTGSLRGRSLQDDAEQRGSRSPAQRDSSQSSNSKLIHQKDKVIEDLRLELAEAQIRLVEMENAGGGRVRELERVLLETRMTNAKLMEESESYQVLLSEKTLNGDLAKGALFNTSSSAEQSSEPQSATRNRSSTLADELENANSDTELEPDQTRKLEAELTATKEQNKALTLYINKIISRLLQNEQFESLFTGEDSSGQPVLRSSTNIETDKALPPPPSEETEQAQENAAPSLLQRAGSIFGGRKPRPTSIRAPAANENLTTPAGMNPPLSATSDMSESAITDSGAYRVTANEDPNRAPSLPIKRSSSTRGSANRGGHRRSRSDWSGSIVNNMVRGTSSSNTATTGSPPSFSSRQASYNALTGGPPPPLILEDNENGGKIDQEEATNPNVPRSDVASDSGYAESVGGSLAPSDSGDMPSPPRSSDGKPLSSNTVFSSGSGGKMRPLRLVQEQKEAEDAEKKKANRNSFMGWFQRGSITTPQALQPTNQPSRTSFQEQRPSTGGSQSSR